MWARSFKSIAVHQLGRDLGGSPAFINEVKNGLLLLRPCS